MSRSERQSFEIGETKRRVLERYGGRCAIRGCEKPATQCGHVLPQDKVHLRRYGEAVIHHPANMEPVCGLAHNAAVQINYRSRPRDAEQYAQYVRHIIQEEQRHEEGY